VPRYNCSEAISTARPGSNRSVTSIFFQAALVAIAPAYLAVWTLLIPIWPYHDYSRWKEPYIGLLALAIGIETGAFVLPMWKVHRLMTAQKASLLSKADQLSREIVSLRSKLADTANAGEQDAVRARMDVLTQACQEIEELPTWPVDSRTRRRFAVNNLLMLVPLGVQFVGATGPWQRLAEGLARFLAQS
jgi:hypothetical protein